MADFWALRLFTRFGTALAVAVALAIPGAALLCAWTGGFIGWQGVAASAAAGCFAGFFLKVFADLTRVIVEMLLPSSS